MRRAWVALKQTARRKVALGPIACMVSLLSCTQTKPRAPGRCRSWRAKHKRTFFTGKHITRKADFSQKSTPIENELRALQKASSTKETPNASTTWTAVASASILCGSKFLLPKFVCIANSFPDEHAAQTTSVVLT